MTGRAAGTRGDEVSFVLGENQVGRPGLAFYGGHFSVAREVRLLGHTPSKARRSLLVGVSIILVSMLAAVGWGSTSNASAASSGTLAAVSSAKPTAASKTNKTELCQARNQLQTSVKSLKSSIKSRNVSGIKTSAKSVQSDFNNVKKAAKGTYKPQIEAVQSSLNKLKTAVGKLGNGHVRENLTAVRTTGGAVGTSVQNLVTTLKTSCGK